MKPLVYTFRSFPAREDLSPDVFLFGMLKKDLELFFTIIQERNPTWIVGVGAARSTQFETQAVNRFHASKRILAYAPEAYKLYIPKTDVPISQSVTDSFCNWTAYRIAHFLAESGYSTRLSFLHVTKHDAEKVNDFLI